MLRELKPGPISRLRPKVNRRPTGPDGAQLAWIRGSTQPIVPS